jgi:hypothetical protein
MMVRDCQLRHNYAQTSLHSRNKARRAYTNAGNTDEEKKVYIPSCLCGCGENNLTHSLCVGRRTLLKNESEKALLFPPPHPPKVRPHVSCPLGALFRPPEKNRPNGPSRSIRCSAWDFRLGASISGRVARPGFFKNRAGGFFLPRFLG